MSKFGYNNFFHIEAFREIKKTRVSSDNITQKLSLKKTNIYFCYSPAIQENLV